MGLLQTKPMSTNNLVISVKVGAATKYVRGNRIDEADKKRRPILVDDIDKAKPFHSATDAHNYYTKFVDAPIKKYNVEPYQKQVTACSTAPS